MGALRRPCNLKDIKMDPVELNFARPFKLRLEDGEEISFSAGPQLVPAKYADHWYVLDNLVPPPAPEPDPAPVTDDAALNAAFADKEVAEAAAKAAQEALAKAEADHQAALEAAAAEKAAALAEAEAAKKKVADAERVAEEALAQADIDQKTIADLKAQIDALNSGTKTKG